MSECFISPICAPHTWCSRRQDGTGAPGARVTGDCSLNIVSAGNQNQVFSKSDQYSWLLNHLSKLQLRSSKAPLRSRPVDVLLYWLMNKKTSLACDRAE